MQREQYFLQCADNTLANDECESVNEIDAAISEAEAEYKYNGKLYDAITESFTTHAPRSRLCAQSISRIRGVSSPRPLLPVKFITISGFLLKYWRVSFFSKRRETV